MINKKANVVTDLSTFMLILFAMAMVGLLGLKVMNNVNDMMQTSDIEQVGKDSLQANTNQYDNTLDNMIFTALVLLWILVFVASFMINAHPIFFTITLFLCVFVFIVMAVLSNTFGSITAGELGVYAAMLPKTLFIMNHFLEIGLAVAFTTAIGLYAKA